MTKKRIRARTSLHTTFSAPEASQVVQIPQVQVAPELDEVENIEPIEHQETNYAAPNKRSPKPDNYAGFDVGFNVDTYATAAFVLATLSQGDNSSSGCPLKYELPTLEERAQFNKILCKLNKRYVYDLAYSAMKYKRLFEDVLLDSDFFSKHSFSDDQNALLIIYLVDLNNRKWEERLEFKSDASSQFKQDFENVEDAVVASKTKLHASLAKKRVKAQSRSINFFLPDALRVQEENRGLVPISAWVSCEKTVKTIMEDKEFEKFSKKENFEQNLEPFEYKYDKNLDNVIHFCGSQKDLIYRLKVVEKSMITIQDKSSVLAVDSVFKLINALEPVDVLLTECSSGWTVCQLALRIKAYSETLKKRTKQIQFLYGRQTVNTKVNEKELGRKMSSSFGIKDGEEEVDDPDDCFVYTYFHGSDESYEVLMERFEACNVKDYIRVIRQPFSSAVVGDTRLARVKVVMVSTQCSRTSVADPIELLIEESQPDSSMEQLLSLKPQAKSTGGDILGVRHLGCIKQAMSVVPSANAIVYLTRSVHASENETVVSNALKQQLQKGHLGWKLSPPVVMLKPSDIRASEGNFLQIPPTQFENGCFIAVLSRKLSTEKDTSREMVKKAALQGLIIPDAEAEPEVRAPERRGSTHAKINTGLGKR